MIAESVLMKHQLLIVNRSQRPAPNLLVVDRLIAGFCSLWIKPTRLLRTGITLKPSTLLHFHQVTQACRNLTKDSLLGRWILLRRQATWCTERYCRYQKPRSHSDS